MIAAVARPQAGAVIGRHQHQHLGARVGGAPGSIGGNLRAEMAAGDDDRHAPGHMRRGTGPAMRLALASVSRNCSE